MAVDELSGASGGGETSSGAVLPTSLEGGSGASAEKPASSQRGAGGAAEGGGLGSGSFALTPQGSASTQATAAAGAAAEAGPVPASRRLSLLSAAAAPGPSAMLRSPAAHRSAMEAGSPLHAPFNRAGAYGGGAPSPGSPALASPAPPAPAGRGGGGAGGGGAGGAAAAPSPPPPAALSAAPPSLASALISDFGSHHPLRAVWLPADAPPSGVWVASAGGASPTAGAAGALPVAPFLALVAERTGERIGRISDIIAEPESMEGGEE
jgi:hypothetical protein